MWTHKITVFTLTFDLYGDAIKFCNLNILRKLIQLTCDVYISLVTLSITYSVWLPLVHSKFSDCHHMSLYLEKLVCVKNCAMELSIYLKKSFLKFLTLQNELPSQPSKCHKWTRIHVVVWGLNIEFQNWVSTVGGGGGVLYFLSDNRCMTIGSHYF